MAIISETILSEAGGLSKWASQMLGLGSDHRDTARNGTSPKSKIASVFNRKVLLMGTAAMVVQASPAFGQAVTPFSCSVEPYGVINNPSNLVTLDPDTGTNTNAVAVDPASRINGLGYNTIDNFAYGINEDRDIVRLDVNGNLTNLGQPTGPGNYNPRGAAGAMDTAGNLYLIRNNAVFIVDIGNNPAAGTLTYTRLSLSGLNVNLDDITFSVTDGNLYGLSDGDLVRVNLSTGMVSAVATTGDTLVDGAGGAWSTADGTVFLYVNGTPSTGILFSVDVSAATPVVTRVGDVARNGSFDAFACLPPILTKQASTTSSSPGSGYSYTYNITNAFSTPITVSFDDVLPSGITFDAGSVSAPGGGSISTFDDDALRITGITIPGSGSVSFTADVTVDSGVAAGTNIDNQATILFGTTVVESDDPSTAAALDPARVGITAPVAADLVTQKTLTSGDTTPDVGDTVTFEIEVTNNGPAAATNVTLTDLIPDGLTATANNGDVSQGSYDDGSGLWTIGTLANGATATLTIEGVVNGSQGGETIENTTTAAVSADISDPTNDDDDLVESFTVNNVGADTTIAAPACGVDSAIIFTGLTFDSIDPDGVRQDTYRLSNSAVIGGIVVDVLVEFSSVPDGTTLPRISASNGNFSYNLSSAAGTVSATYSIVEAGTNNSLVGNYRLRFGDIDNLERIGVTTSDIAVAITNNPTNLTIQEIGGVTTAIGASGNRSSVAEDTFEVAIVGRSTFTVTARANSGINAGFQLDGNLSSPLSAVACSSDIVTVKTLGSGDATPAQGDVVTYEIEVGNSGPALINDLSLTDLIPDGLTATTNNGDVSQGSYDDSSGLWSIGTLDVGANATLTIEGTVDDAQGDETITNNTTAATSPTLNDTSSAGDDLTEAVVIAPSVDLVITKTNTPGVNGEVDQASDTLTSGATTTYTLTVTNNGPDSVTGAVVTDTPTAGLTCPGTNPVAISGDGVPSGSFTVADITGAGITLDTLDDGQSTTLSFSCQVN